MPTYAFRCEPCQHEFEVRTSWDKKAAVACPKCAKQELTELFGKYRLNALGSGGATSSPPASGFT